MREESFGIGAGGSGHDSEEEAEDVGADADGFLGGVDEVFGARARPSQTPHPQRLHRHKSNVTTPLNTHTALGTPVHKQSQAELFWGLNLRSEGGEDGAS